MFLSRVELDDKRRSTMCALAAPQEIHGAVESSFPGERKRRLWRLDRFCGKLYLLLLSEDKPNPGLISNQFGPSDNPKQMESYDYSVVLDRVTAGSVWRFRLTANPTKSRGSIKKDLKGRAKRFGVYGTQDQKKWLMDRTEENGFSLDQNSFDVVESKELHFVKGREQRSVTLLSVSYEGVLKVTDPDSFRNLLVSGIGRGRAYGMGLVTIQRVHS